MSNINHTNLTNCDLSGSTDFANANLAGAILTGVTIDNVTDLSSAILDGVISGGIVYVDNSQNQDQPVPTKLPANWCIKNGYLVGPGANLVNADLSGEDLSLKRLFNADFTGANLSNTKFVSAALSKCNFSGADVSGAVFAGANLEYTVFACTTFSDSTSFKKYMDGTTARSKSAVLNGIMSGSIIDSANAVFAYSTPAISTDNLPSNWKIVNGYLVGPGANLINAVL